jgi:hypothetical protein
VYTLLDLPEFDLLALGSKRDHTPRDIVDITLTIQDLIYPIF